MTNIVMTDVDVDVDVVMTICGVVMTVVDVVMSIAIQMLATLRSPFKFLLRSPLCSLRTLALGPHFCWFH